MAPKFFLVMVLFTLSFGATALAVPSRILLIRHAEKPEDPDNSNLSTKGFKRATALKNLFKIHPEYASKGLPSAIFATKYIPGKSAKRALQTATPLAQSLGLSVKTPNRGSETELLADTILNSDSLNGKVVFITWVHGKIPQLASALESNCPADWDGDDVYDRVWEIDYSSRETTCRDLPQSLFPTDSK